MADAEVFGLTHEGDWIGVAVDNLGHAICVPYMDHIEHEGRAFVAANLWPALTTLASGLFVFINDTNVNARVGFAVTASGLVTVSLWEGMSFTGGNTVPVMAMNRLVTRASGCRAFHSVVPTSWGTELLRDFVPASQLLALGGAEQELPRWHLQQGLAYCVQIINTTGANIYGSVMATVAIEAE